MNPPAYPNHVREALSTRRFMLSIEVATARATQPFDDAIRPVLALARQIRDDPRIDAIALTDRSRSDHDHDPVVVGHRVAEASGKMPIVHWAGKDRALTTLEADVARANALGLDTLLLVTGDKVRQQPADRPVRYLDSVNALYAARRRAPQLLLAAAVSPFKYREEELINQYLKAAKKLRAGANLLMTQIGWDPRKFEELRWFLDRRGYRAPLVAELLLLTPARSRRIRRIGLPGVTITDGLAQRLEEDASSPDGGRAAAFRRLALQMASLRDLGYAGAQVSGLETYAGRCRDGHPGISDPRSAPAGVARVVDAQRWPHRAGRPLRRRGPHGIGACRARGPDPGEGRPAARRTGPLSDDGSHRSSALSGGLLRCAHAHSGPPSVGCPVRAGRSAAPSGTSHQGTIGGLSILWLLPASPHRLCLPGDLPQRAGQRSLRWHEGQRVRVRRPGVHSQPDLPRLEAGRPACKS